jgi:cyclohexyl-isocyanide hydratase
MSEGASGSELLAGFVLFPGFTGLDLVGPHEVLVRSTPRCLLVARTLEAVKSSHGLRVLPDLTFSTCPQLDILVVPGGPGQEQAIHDDELIGFIARQSSRRYPHIDFAVCVLAVEVGMWRVDMS